MKSKKITQTHIKRDRNVLLSQQGFINLNTKSVRDKSKYSRKSKHNTLTEY